MSAPRIGDELFESIGAGFPHRPLLGEPVVDDARGACDSSVQVRTRPDFAVWINPQRSSVRTCFMNDGSVIAADSASSLTLAGPRPSTPTTARRVGSESAANTSSSPAEYLAIWLSITGQQERRKGAPGR